ncbi:hypothetical protein Tco_0991178 [Tanacetum coccineum]|uniref:Uncharacterized protein n=1 Tax=Tanacetum coccineum TaxID=301880 RepID=A0ABQ5EZ60_9ASTR
MWDELAKQFKKDEIEKVPRLIIIVVSSCRISKYKDVQLETNPVTFFYMNPQTQEAADAYTMEYGSHVRPRSQTSTRIDVGTTHHVASEIKLQQKQTKPTPVKTTGNKTRQPTGLMINESTSKDNGVDTELSTSTALTTKDSTNEDKSMPARGWDHEKPYFVANQKP